MGQTTSKAGLGALSDNWTLSVAQVSVPLGIVCVQAFEGLLPAHMALLSVQALLPGLTIDEGVAEGQPSFPGPTSGPFGWPGNPPVFGWCHPQVLY